MQKGPPIQPPKGKAANPKARFATPPFFSNPHEKAVLFDLSPLYGGQGAFFTDSGSGSGCSGPIF